LYYETAGEGHPLVLLHDGLLDGRSWDYQFEAFSESYKTIRYDVRGHGGSERPDGEFSHVDDLHALLGFLDVERAHLLGASNGGRIAVDFALENLGMVSSLILVGPSLSGYRFSDEKRRRISDIFSAAREEDPQKWAEMWLNDPFWAPDRKHTAARRRLQKLLIEAFYSFSRASGSRERQDCAATEKLSEINAPTLIMIGERDDPDNHAIADLLELSIPGAEKVVVPDAAHMLNLEKPEEFTSSCCASWKVEKRRRRGERRPERAMTEYRRPAAREGADTPPSYFSRPGFGKRACAAKHRS